MRLKSNHRTKLIKLTRLNDESLNELIALCIKNIQFIDHRILPIKDWNFALGLLTEIDLKDAPFLALSRHLKAKLWSGDKQLRKGLSKQGFQHYVVETSYLLNRLKKK